MNAERRELAALILTDELEEKRWQYFLQHKDVRIAFEAFKLLKSYKSGKPVQPISAPADQPTEVRFITAMRIPR